MIGPLKIIRNNNKKINLGLIGVGRWGYNYINSIKKFEQITISGVVTKSNQFNNRLPEHIKIYDSWKNLCNSSTIDGIVVATPPSTHIEIANYAITNNLPVLIEKPLSLSLDETLDFFKKIKLFKKNIMVNFIHLYNPIYIEMKNQLSAIGKIRSIESNSGDWGPFREKTPPLWDWGCHDIAMCLDLINEPPKKIYKKVILSRQKNLFPNAQPPLNIKIELNFQNDIKVKIFTGNLMKKKCRFFRINCEKGYIEFDDIKKSLFINKNGDKTQINNIPNINISPLESAIDHFRELIIHGKNSNLELAVEVTKVLDKIG